MKILFDINHPADVHLFKNLIRTLEDKNHDIFITAREKEITTSLLDKYGFQFEVVSTIGEGIIGLTKELLLHQRKIYKILRKNKIDITLSIGGTFNVYATRLLDIPCIVFNDSERATFQNFITNPFVTVVMTPYCYKGKIGKKQIRLDSFKEIAYLSKKYFEPDSTIYENLNINKNDKFIIMRFVGWGASHDIGKTGFELNYKRQAVKELSKYAKVFITSESQLPKDLEKYRIKFSPEKIHDALYYSHLLIGDSQTMTTEAAVLGTPAIRSNSFVGTNDMMNFIELEKKYGLIYNIRNPEDAIQKAIELIQKPTLKQKWQKKREKLLQDKIDITAFMVWFIDNYPDSINIMMENPSFQRRFK